jgi:hypothetical protein
MPAFYVSPNGCDTNPGTRAKPFASLQAARDAVRKLNEGGKLDQPVTVYLADGTYFLDTPLVLKPEDSGAPLCPVTWTAEPGARPVISGGVAIGGWREEKVNGKKAWVADLPEVAKGKWTFAELWVNGERRSRPRLPREGFFRVAEQPDVTPDTRYDEGQIRFVCHPGDVRAWRNLSDVQVCALTLWTESWTPIASVDESTNMVNLTTKTVRRLTDDFGPHGCRYFVENVFEALDQPGEWYLDRPEGKLYYLPKRGEKLGEVEVIAPRLEQVVRIQGKPGRPVAGIRFEGISFAHTEWRLPPDSPGASQAAVTVPGAIYAEHTEGCVFHECEVAHIGNYAIEFGAGCSGNMVSYCELHDLGAGGVKVMQDSAYTTVADCEIHDCGRVFFSAVGVLITQSNDNQVVHNHIHHLYYTGVSVGWSWGYAPSSAARNVVEYNHIHDIGMGLLSDMGAVYTLGDSPGTRVCHNLVHDIVSYGYGGWGLYTDEGSTGILLANNVVYGTKCGGFHQHYGKENLLQNNIFAFAKENQINRTRAEEHVSYTFQRNIVVIDNGNLLGGNWEGDNFRLDYNLYYDTRGPVKTTGPAKLRDWRKRGHDIHSIFADPLFVNPAKGDFRLKPGSPAERIGFQPIDVSKVGPRPKPK